VGASALLLCLGDLSGFGGKVRYVCFAGVFGRRFALASGVEEEGCGSRSSAVTGWIP
jgi:hypothetical protein